MLMQRSHHIGITLPITTAAKRIAQQFADQCPFQEKAGQIKRNTLAVSAVNDYLKLMEIPTSVAESDSWSPMMQMMGDVADLKVPGVGTLSCRPVSVTDEACTVPPEDWSDRAGYIAIALDEEMSQATLIGFLETVGEQEQIALSEFAPIEALIDQVHTLQAANQAASQPAGLASLAQTARTMTSTMTTQISEWIEGGITATWEAADALINPADMSFAFRTTAELSRQDNAVDISRAKLIDLGLQLGQSVQVALVVHVTQHVSDDDTMPDSSDIVLQIRPFGESAYLPEGLSLTLLDEDNTLLKSATSRSIDNYIQIRLSGESGETFGVQVTINDATFAEKFVI